MDSFENKNEWWWWGWWFLAVWYGLVTCSFFHQMLTNGQSLAFSTEYTPLFRYVLTRICRLLSQSVVFEYSTKIRYFVKKNIEKFCPGKKLWQIYWTERKFVLICSTRKSSSNYTTYMIYLKERGKKRML